jgi:hypothetical protein
MTDLQTLREYYGGVRVVAKRRKDSVVFALI